MKVYLADDDEDDVYLFSEALQSVNKTVAFESANNGQELLEKMDKGGEPPYLIFLDVNMPKMNGLEALKEIKSQGNFNDVWVIMFSTSISKENVEKAFQLGADLYIQKPTEYDSLKDVIHKYLQPGALTRPPDGEFLVITNN
jgi:CheY-like chemotaxis protein